LKVVPYIETLPARVPIDVGVLRIEGASMPKMEDHHGTGVTRLEGDVELMWIISDASQLSGDFQRCGAEVWSEPGRVGEGPGAHGYGAGGDSAGASGVLRVRWYLSSDRCGNGQKEE
jgi:hypothetical protein